MTPKPREWWICEVENEVCGSLSDIKRIAPEASPIHVVEHSAYAAALEVVYEQELTIEKQSAIISVLAEALGGIIEIGKRDMSNPKYDGYFDDAKDALEKLKTWRGEQVSDTRKQIVLVAARTINIFLSEAQNLFKCDDITINYNQGCIETPTASYRYVRDENSLRGYHGVRFEVWGPPVDWVDNALPLIRAAEML